MRASPTPQKINTLVVSGMKGPQVPGIYLELLALCVYNQILESVT